jgi:glutathione S-transferase
VDAVVSQQATLCGGRFTVADISVGFALMLAEFIGLNAKFSPAVAAYWQSLKERDGFRRAIAKQDSDPNVRSVRKFLKQR